MSRQAKSSVESASAYGVVSSVSYRAVVCWDFDGPMNAEYVGTEDRHEVALESSPAPVSIPYPRHIKAVLDILHSNGVLSVPGSQRLLYNEEATRGLQDIMYQAFDECFSESRKYLLKEHGAIISSGIDPDSTGSSKTPYLDRIKTIPGLQHISNSQVVLVDDGFDYKICQEHGYPFVYASRCKQFNLYEDRYYFFDTMVTLGFTEKKIMSSIATVKCDEDVKQDLFLIYENYKSRKATAIKNALTNFNDSADSWSITQVLKYIRSLFYDVNDVDLENFINISPDGRRLMAAMSKIQLAQVEQMFRQGQGDVEINRYVNRENTLQGQRQQLNDKLFKLKTKKAMELLVYKVRYLLILSQDAEDVRAARWCRIAHHLESCEKVIVKEISKYSPKYSSLIIAKEVNDLFEKSDDLGIRFFLGSTKEQRLDARKCEEEADLRAICDKSHTDMEAEEIVGRIVKPAVGLEQVIREQSAEDVVVEAVDAVEIGQQGGGACGLFKPRAALANVIGGKKSITASA